MSRVILKQVPQRIPSEEFIEACKEVAQRKGLEVRVEEKRTICLRKNNEESYKYEPLALQELDIRIGPLPYLRITGIIQQGEMLGRVICIYRGIVPPIGIATQRQAERFGREVLSYFE